MQIFVSEQLFGAIAHQIADGGASQWPEFTWTVRDEATAWPADLTDAQWAAQNWLHERLEEHLGHAIGAEPAPEPAPSAGSAGSSPKAATAPTQAEVASSEPPPYVAELLATARYFAESHRPGPAPVTFTVTAEALRAELERQATEAEEAATKVEADAAKRAAAISSHAEAPPAPAPLAPEAPAKRARGKKAADEAAALPGLLDLPAGALPPILQLPPCPGRLGTEDVRGMVLEYGTREAKGLRDFAHARRFLAASVTRPVLEFTWKDFDQLFGRDGSQIIGGRCC